jgi:hypothetical protein
MDQLIVMWEEVLPRKDIEMLRRSKASGGTSTKSSSGKTTTGKLSNNDTRSSVPKKKKKRHSQSSLTKEFKKAKSPTFYGEIKKGEEVKAWLLGMRKYF